MKFFNKRLIEINPPSNLFLLKPFPDQKEIRMNDIWKKKKSIQF